MKDLIKGTFHSIVIYQNLLRQGVLSQWNIKTVRHAIEIFKIGINIGNFDEFISSEYINKESQLQSHNDSHRYPLKRPEEFLNTVKKFSTAFPDLYYKQRDHGRKYEDNTRIRILRANDPIGKGRKLSPFCRSLYF
jgi:hypothetical protein